MDSTTKKYAPSEVAQYYNKSVRTIQRYCDTHDITRTAEGYILSLEDLKSMANYYYPKGYPSDLTAFLNELGVWHQAEHEKAIEESKKIRQTATANDNSKQHSATNDIPINDALRVIAVEAMEKDLVHKLYSIEEYHELIGQSERLKAVEENTAELKEQIAYLRESNKELRELLKDGLGSIQKALTTLSERNTLEAKEKGLLK